MGKKRKITEMTEFFRFFRNKRTSVICEILARKIKGYVRYIFPVLLFKAKR